MAKKSRCFSSRRDLLNVEDRAAGGDCCLARRHYWAHVERKGALNKDGDAKKEDAGAKEGAAGEGAKKSKKKKSKKNKKEVDEFAGMDADERALAEAERD